MSYTSAAPVSTSVAVGAAGDVFVVDDTVCPVVAENTVVEDSRSKAIDWTPALNSTRFAPLNG